MDQQFKQFIKYLKPGHRCQSLSGDDEVTSVSMNNIIEVNDVVVMTPQILLNALDSGELPSLTVFSLLIFDECHHMKKHYPYNDIMTRYYIDEKLSNSLTSLRLPQVSYTPFDRMCSVCGSCTCISCRLLSYSWYMGFYQRLRVTAYFHHRSK